MDKTRMGTCCAFKTKISSNLVPEADPTNNKLRLATGLQKQLPAAWKSSRKSVRSRSLGKLRRSATVGLIRCASVISRTDSAFSDLNESLSLSYSDSEYTEMSSFAILSCADLKSPKTPNLAKSTFHPVTTSSLLRSQTENGSVYLNQYQLQQTIDSCIPVHLATDSSGQFFVLVEHASFRGDISDLRNCLPVVERIIAGSAHILVYKCGQPVQGSLRAKRVQQLHADLLTAVSSVAHTGVFPLFDSRLVFQASSGELQVPYAFLTGPVTQSAVLEHWPETLAALAGTDLTI